MVLAMRGKGYTLTRAAESYKKEHLSKQARGDTFRAVYTVRVGDAIHVLHGFQK